jgi:lysophospholipase L1-like esterase
VREGRRVGRTFAALIALALLNGCSGGSQGQSANRVADTASSTTSTVAGAGTETPLPPGSSVDPGPRTMIPATRVLFLGTSLTAGYGLENPDEAWPNRIAQFADSAGLNVTIVNAGLSGETSAGALRRTDWLLRDSADVVVIETGANDGLRGTSVAQLRSNLTAMVGKVRSALPNAKVVIVQMEAPPNLGNEYVSGFRKVFPEVAEATGSVLTPFLLDGVAARNVWPVIRGVLESVRKPVPAM